MRDTLRERIAHYTRLDAPVGFEEPVLRQVRDELAAITDGYKRIAGFDKATLQAKGWATRRCFIR